MSSFRDEASADLVRSADDLLRQGRYAEAIGVYSRALEIEPALPDAWFNLAWAQRAERRFDEALTSYGQAIAQGVEKPEEALLNRATIFSEYMFQPARAVNELQAALMRNPDYVPALLNLANVHEDLGVVEDALAGYRRVLTLEPGNGRAHARLGALQVLSGQPGAAVAALKAALPLAPSVEARAEILFSLGSALDGVGDYHDAFQAFEAANMHARAAAPEAYDPIGQQEMTDRVIETFSTAQPIPRKENSPDAPRDPDQQPVFICGMFRSGSTLVEQILGRHDAITAGGELDYIPALVRKLQPYPEVTAALPDAVVATLRDEYVRGLPGTGFVTDKRSDNFLHIGLIKQLFPNAKIIHTVRQPLDNLLSVYFLHFGHEISYGYSLPEVAHFYIQYRRAMNHFRTLYAADIHDVDYDALVASPRETIARSLDFLGLPWDEKCLTPAKADGAIRTPSAWQTRKPLHRLSSGRWRNYEDKLGTVRKMLAEAGL